MSRYHHAAFRSRCLAIHICFREMFQVWESSISNIDCWLFSKFAKHSEWLDDGRILLQILWNGNFEQSKVLLWHCQMQIEAPKSKGFTQYIMSFLLFNAMTRGMLVVHTWCSPSKYRWWLFPRHCQISGSDLRPKLHCMLKALKWKSKCLLGFYSNSCVLSLVNTMLMST